MMHETMAPEAVLPTSREKRSPSTGRLPILRYGIAVASVTAAVAVCLLINPRLHSLSHLMLLAAVVITARIAGAGPALLTVVLGVVAEVVLSAHQYPRPQVAPTFPGTLFLDIPLILGVGGSIVLLTRHLAQERRRVQIELRETRRHQKLLEREILERQRAESQVESLDSDLHHSEERYRAFVANSSEAIWLFESDTGVPVDLPPDQQINLIYESGRLSECNSAMAELHGYPSIEAIQGTELEQFLPRSDARNLEFLHHFIEAAYRLTNVETREQDRDGNQLILLNSLVGIVENGRLMRAWGTSRDVTQQRQAEEALRLSEERFRLAAQAVSALIYEWDFETDQVVRSTGLFELLGFAPEEAEPTAEWWTSRVHPDDQIKTGQAGEAVKNGTDYYSLEYRVRHHDGRWVHVWDRGQVIRDKSGRPVRAYGSAVDITSQVETHRRIEAMASAAELHFRQLEGVFQSMSEGVAVFAAGDNLISMNTAMMRMNGFEPGEDFAFRARELSACFESRLPGGGPRPALEDLPAMRALRGEQVVDWELEVRRKGETKYKTFSYNATPVRNAEGDVALAVVTARDITEQKQAEAALRQSELHYRTLADSVPCIVYTAVPDQGVDYANRAWYEYTGLTPEGTLGFACFSAFHPDERDSVLRAWFESQVTGTPFSKEYRLRGADGTYRWFLGRAIALRNEAGRVIKWFGTSMDIEDQKRAEAEIRRANEQLAATRDQAIEANRAKSAFLANISHELRTPLTAIIGYAEMMEEAAQEQEWGQQELQDLANIDSAARHLLTLINGLLDLAKVEAGRMDLKLSEFDIPELVTEVAETVLPLARSNGNELSVVCPPDLGEMTADAVKVRQALINLLSNACKFTDQGKIELAASRRCIQGQDWIEFRVTDTGIGIDPDQLDVIFSEFVQADSAATRRHDGTGLGLAITKRFCEIMGGQVLAESEPRQGSTFTLQLPARVKED